MYKDNLQEGKQILVFRMKRQHPDIEYDTLGFLEQPRKLAKITNRLSIPCLPKVVSELFLQRVDCADNGHQMKTQLVGTAQNASSKRRSQIRTKLIQSLRNQNYNAGTLRVIDLDDNQSQPRISKPYLQEGAHCEVEKTKDVFYILETRKAQIIPNEKTVVFPSQLVPYILDSEEEQPNEQMDDSDRDSDQDQVSYSVKPGQSWLETQNGSDVEYIDHYSSFNTRFRNKKHYMS